MKTEPERCPWCLGSDAYKRYHDEEWGVPCRDERKLFEFLILEGAQAGLSWSTILGKREHYREAFDDWDVTKIARYSDAKIEKLMLDPGIVRNRLKIESTRTNAKAMLAFTKTEGSFSDWLWAHVDNKPLLNSPRERGDVPAKTALSDAISKALLKRGFKFVGSTIVYAYLQAMGLVNDHFVGCHRHPDYSKTRKKK
ncbi:MAG: DNA-3-methyladenine glycosylase [Hydrocarboniphaga sp.]|uniref:DNA-3-methyladenine glycosylase I n=1 Tax=Hydrocarboniphaga sp. TaxID=2033016 RepID=UPI002608026F|nr:DNA-3-methyladenine glycosylase I [Hydrocarboniphaga sp.]MDB5971317.1 DNA-3-methyladenine glycosylase [Hydrocarboniphaga sp.]